MAVVSEIVFSDIGSNDAPDLTQPQSQVSVDGWFDGFGDLLTVDDVAAILHVSRKTVQTLCKRGDLPAIKIGRRWYVPKIRLVEYLLTGQKIIE